MEKRKAKSFRTASWIVGAGGFALCLWAIIGWVFYKLLTDDTFTLPELNNKLLESPMPLLIAGGAALVFIIIGIVLRVISATHKNRALYEDVAEEEEEVDEAADEVAEEVAEEIGEKPVAAAVKEDKRSKGRKLLAAKASKVFSKEICDKIDASAEKAEYRAGSLKENAGWIVSGLALCALVGSKITRNKFLKERAFEQYSLRRGLYRWLG